MLILVVMRTDKKLLAKGIRYIGYTTGLMFMAPFVVHQAFNNQGHPAHVPVLAIGLALGATAIGFGFYTVKLFTDALFGRKSKN